MYEFFVAFGHLSINTKVNLKQTKKGLGYRFFVQEVEGG